jgi:hypothetical protein
MATPNPGSAKKNLKKYLKEFTLVPFGYLVYRELQTLVVSIKRLGQKQALEPSLEPRTRSGVLGKQRL